MSKAKTKQSMVFDDKQRNQLLRKYKSEASMLRLLCDELADAMLLQVPKDHAKADRSVTQIRQAATLFTAAAESLGEARTLANETEWT